MLARKWCEDADAHRQCWTVEADRRAKIISIIIQDESDFILLLRVRRAENAW